MVDQNNKFKKVIGDGRRDELNLALEAIHFGFKALISKPDEQLAEIGYSRIHHRVLYFIGRHANCSVNELLKVMDVSKQYLNRPLRQLTDDGYVRVKIDSKDRRVRRIKLSGQGEKLEFELSNDQRLRFEAVFEVVGPQAEAGWRKVMQLMASSADTK
jgi:DNA-binding MarR family transcriptional regulator